MSEPLAAGIDLGGTKIYSLIANAKGDVLGEDRCPTHAADGGPDAVVSRIAESVGRALEQAGLTTNDIAGAGISSPGPCEPASGIVTDAPNLPGFHNVPLARLLSDALNVPSVLENDANAAAYGEFRLGAGQGVRHLIYVTLGTGIGGGIIIDGKVYWGASGAAGEVGHLVVDEDGPPCNCGGRGCVEALASGPAIAREAKRAVREGLSPLLAELAGEGPMTAEIVHQAALRGDAVAREVMERAGRYLGLGLVGLLNCFNPEALILGGGLTNLGSFYLEPAVRTAREGAFEQVVSDVTISLAKLGERAGALGAATIMLDGKPR
jgi:glucokinase